MPSTHRIEATPARSLVPQLVGMGKGESVLRRGLSLEGQPIGVVNQAIQDRIGDRRIREAGVPTRLRVPECGPASRIGHNDRPEFRATLETEAGSADRGANRQGPGTRHGQVVEELGVGAVGVGQG